MLPSYGLVEGEDDMVRLTYCENILLIFQTLKFELKHSSTLSL